MENLENKTKQDEALTKEAEDGVTISKGDAQEYRAYKRQKKIAEITGAIARSGTPIGFKDDIKRLTERAARFHQSAVKVNLTQLSAVKNNLFKSAVKLDCTVGGSGETLSKVKAYEARLARKSGAKEVTLVLTPSLIAACRYGELKKEIRKVKRAAKTARLKVWMDKKYPFPMLARIARLASEMGAEYFCVPYFAGCERLRYDLLGKCRLEVSEVETLDDFKKMTGAGVERIVTSHISEFYLEWMKEAENIELCIDKKREDTSVATKEEPENTQKPHSAVSDLKFV